MDSKVKGAVSLDERMLDAHLVKSFKPQVDTQSGPEKVHFCAGPSYC